MAITRIAFLTYGVAARLGKIVAVKVSIGMMMLAAPVAADGATHEVTVLALGDSLTQGFGLREADGLVPQLQRRLDEKDLDVRVINAGVSGDTTAGGAARVAWSLTPEVDAMIVTLGANDMLRGLDPGQAKTNLEQILQVAQAEDVEVLLVRVKAPGNFGADYKEAFDGLYPELAEAYDTLFFENFFLGLGSDDPAELRAFFQRDGIHPNAQGVARIVDALAPAVVELVTRAASK